MIEPWPLFHNGAVIDTDQKLAAHLPQLRAAPWLAVDTEADSLHAYPEKVCLIQLSLPGHDLLVDPLARIDLAPLLEVFRNHELLMHGADYDLRLLRRRHAFTAGRIFDTMLAARLLGIEEFGLQNLVERFLGVKLEKGPQKSNWARRPLTERMEAYARNDTHYLKPLVDLLRAQLIERGRLEWHAETCARLVEECSVPPPERDGDAWRVKGSSKLDRHEQAVLRAIWEWREGQAISANRPPFFVLSHEAMVGMAAAAVRTHGTAHLPPHLSPARQSSLRDTIRRAYELQPTDWPHTPRVHGRRLTEAQMRRAEHLRVIRDKHAKALGMDPSLIAPRALLLDLAHDWNQASTGLMKWQLELLKQ